jgi:hypothetical protein
MDPFRELRTRLADAEDRLAGLSWMIADHPPMLAGIVTRTTADALTAPCYVSVTPIDEGSYATEVEGGTDGPAAGEGPPVAVAFFDRVPTDGELVIASYQTPLGRWIARPQVPTRPTGPGWICSGTSVTITWYYPKTTLVEGPDPDNPGATRLYNDKGGPIVTTCAFRPRSGSTAPHFESGCEPIPSDMLVTNPGTDSDAKFIKWDASCVPDAEADTLNPQVDFAFFTDGSCAIQNGEASGVAFGARDGTTLHYRSLAVKDPTSGGVWPGTDTLLS